MTATESKINDQHNPVPNNTIVIVTEHDSYNNTVFDIVEPLRGNKKRDWFNSHFYFCLPLLIGNQYGFVIKSLYDFTAKWNGGQSTTDTVISIDKKENVNHQIISSHFGSGIVTVQNRFHFRTPAGINIVTLNPPNFILPHMQNMTGVIETDNLRRDFTFNIKITTPNVDINVKKGQPIAAIFPIQRYFAESFDLKLANELFSHEVIEHERLQGSKFAQERSGPDKEKPHHNGRRYWQGEDADGVKFPDHQQRIE